MKKDSSLIKNIPHQFGELAIESSFNAIGFADLEEGTLIYANPAFLEMYGYEDAREVVGKPVAAFWADDEKGRAVVDALKQEGKWEGELTVKKKDGTPFHVYLSAVLVENAQGGPCYLMGSGVDITKLKRAQMEAEFYADVLTHDIRNLNQTIAGHAYFIEYADDDTRKEHVERIKKSIKKFTRLTENIELLRVIEETELEPINLNEYIQASVRQIQEYFDKTIDVTLTADNEYEVRANDHIDTMFFTILENAVEYTPENPVRINIDVTVQNEMCTVSIRDYGIGISQEKKEDILENLETLSKRTGLGFYVVKKVLDHFNGSFAIHPKENGTAIVVRLPRN